MRACIPLLLILAHLTACDFGDGDGDGALLSSCYQHGYDDCASGYQPDPSHWLCDEEVDANAYVDGFTDCLDDQEEE